MQSPETPVPPVAPRRPHVVRSPNGDREDEYYWLRDDARADPAVLRHLEAENAYTQAMLAHVKPLEDRLYDEIVARIKQDESSVPWRHRGWWYYSRYETGLEYPIHARRKGTMTAVEEVMLDVNALAAGHAFFQVAALDVAPDNRLLAYVEDAVGRRQWTLRVKDLATGETLPDRIANVEPALAWAADSRTLFYIEKDPTTLLGCRVRRHVLGTDPATDALVYEEPDDACFLDLGTTKDERYILIASESTVATEIRYAPTGNPSRFDVVVPRERDHLYDVVHLDGRWILRTNWQAPNFRLVEAPVGAAADRSRWREILPHRDDAFIHGVDAFDRFLAISERSNALRKLRIRRFDGSADVFIGSDEAACTVRLGQNPEMDVDVVRYTYTSPATPFSTYDYDVATGTRTLLKRETVLGDFDPARYATGLVFAPAHDGCRIPVTLAYRKDIALDGTAPLLLEGYGAYGLSLDPAFAVDALPLLDRGFVCATAHVRGGQELGRAWYDAGRLLEKRNTFDDFVDATRFLVAERYADPACVFATGGSAGGLLMGAVANLAPELYRGIVVHVPFVDVVTTMLDHSLPLTTNEFDEWGDPREKDFYDYMLSYSPYDNVGAIDYPAMLVTTGLWDSQVQYFEPAKWVARMRSRRLGSKPLLLRTTMHAGHGGKSGRFERFREIAQEYAFVLDLAGIGD